MKSKLISFILALCLLIAIPLEARYKYNPFTRKLDYYETGADIDLGDLADVTLTALASGAVLYYDGSAWVNLPKGLDGQHLGLTLGIPSWETAASPTFLGLTDTPGAYAGKAGQLVRVNAGANALEFFAGSPLGTVIIADGAGGWTKTENYRVSAAGAVTLGSWTATAVANAYVAGINQNLLTTSTPTFDDVTISTPVNIYGLSHNSFADYAANQHVALPNTIASVLSDHNLAVHTALGLFDASADVDHNATTNYSVYKHVGEDHVTDHNVWVGYLAGQDLAVGGQYNTLIGEQAGTDITTADYNTVVGYQAAFIPTTINNMTLVGYQAGYQTTTVGLTAIGFETGRVSTGLGNTFVGYQAGETNTSGARNTFIGFDTGQGKITANDNTGVGYQSLYGTGPTGDRNTAIGVQSLFQTTGTDNTGVGYHAGYSNVAGNNNTYVGEYAGHYNVGGSNNVGIGMYALDGTSGQSNSDNVGVGINAGGSLTTGGKNVLVGLNAGYALSSGGENSYFGYQAGYWQATNSYNVAVGYQAGYGQSGQSNEKNVFVGYQAGLAITTGSSNVLIGYLAGSQLTNENGQLYIDNTNTTTPLIYGDFTADSIRINGELEIPDGKLIELGTDANASFEYDETTNDALIIGIPSVNERGIIVCDKANVGADFTGIIYAGTGQRFNIVDADIDSTLILGFLRDDMPAITANLHALNLNAGAEQNVRFFFDAESGENPEVRIYGYDTGFPGEQYGTHYVDAAGKFHVGAQQEPIIFDQEQRVPVNTNPVDNPPTDAQINAAFGTPSTAGAGYWSYINDNGAETNFYHVVSDGTRWLIFEPYNQHDMIYWIECFDHGIAANRYSQDWDITSLNTQGNGTNTIDTTPSHITLTTDNNAIGDNEGTITHFQIVQRSRRNRSQFGVDLGQTANTQFYCGWNTNQTNAMVATADEYVIVFFDVADNANWQIKVGDGATEDVFTSAVVADTNHIKHTIWVETDGTVHWAVNGAELDITGSVNNLMTANDHYLIFGQAQSVTGAVAIVVEIDYVENEKVKL